VGTSGPRTTLSPEPWVLSCCKGLHGNIQHVKYSCNILVLQPISDDHVYTACSGWHATWHPSTYRLTCKYYMTTCINSLRMDEINNKLLLSCNTFILLYFILFRLYGEPSAEHTCLCKPMVSSIIPCRVRIAYIKLFRFVW